MSLFLEPNSLGLIIEEATRGWGNTSKIIEKKMYYLPKEMCQKKTQGSTVKCVPPGM